MPPATSAVKVTLRELADLAIGTPEVGAVNFTALHTLVVAMLKHLNLQNTYVDFQSVATEPSRFLEPARSSHSAPQLPAEVLAPKEKRRSVGHLQVPALESQVRDLGGQVQDLSVQLQTMDNKVQDIASHVKRLSSQTSGLNLPVLQWPEERSALTLVPEKTQKQPSKALKGSEVIPAKVSRPGGWSPAGGRGGGGAEWTGSALVICPAGHGTAAEPSGGGENPEGSPAEASGAPCPEAPGEGTMGTLPAVPRGVRPCSPDLAQGSTQTLRAIALPTFSE